MARVFERVEAFVEEAGRVQSEPELARLIADVAADLGFAYFALTHHVDPGQASGPAIRLTTYPAEWVDYFDDQGLGPLDPVHRASHLTSVGFSWSQIRR